ncbi:MAG: hypothetical protein L6R38_003888 [Xanthoria sp. 2 TBL-2021]|nr:MAG: hypothetical protein L6R38_003888 [Xanthoria sp. 2 TBL-2021]
MQTTRFSDSWLIDDYVAPSLESIFTTQRAHPPPKQSHQPPKENDKGKQKEDIAKAISQGEICEPASIFVNEVAMAMIASALPAARTLKKSCCLREEAKVRQNIQGEYAADYKESVMKQIEEEAREEAHKKNLRMSSQYNAERKTETPDASSRIMRRHTPFTWKDGDRLEFKLIPNIGVPAVCHSPTHSLLIQAAAIKGTFRTLMNNQQPIHLDEILKLRDPCGAYLGNSPERRGQKIERLAPKWSTIMSITDVLAVRQDAIHPCLIDDAAKEDQYGSERGTGTDRNDMTAYNTAYKAWGRKIGNIASKLEKPPTTNSKSSSATRYLHHAEYARRKHGDKEARRLHPAAHSRPSTFSWKGIPRAKVDINRDKNHPHPVYAIRDWQDGEKIMHGPKNKPILDWKHLPATLTHEAHRLGNGGLAAS